MKGWGADAKGKMPLTESVWEIMNGKLAVGLDSACPMGRTVGVLRPGRGLQEGGQGRGE